MHHLISRLRAVWRAWAAKAVDHPRHEGPVLKVVCFHGITVTRSSSSSMLPGINQTFAHAQCVVEALHQTGHRFLSLGQWARREASPQKSAMIVFDDAYASIIPLLEWLGAAGVPCGVFCCTHQAESGCSFWWDVLWRERQRRGTPERAFRREHRMLLKRPWTEVRDHLTREFGADAVSSVVEESRAMTPTEIVHWHGKGVEIGNHTAHHAALSGMPREYVHRELEEAQLKLAHWTGSVPQAVAYPNGRMDRQVAQIALSLGLRSGFVNRPGNIRLPLRGGSLAGMKLPRWSPGWIAPSPD